MQEDVLIVDVWEANTDFDPEVLRANGVLGCIVRLNDMNGGHHQDKALKVNWEKAKSFELQAIYFVYNPWVSGNVNYLWLMANLPSDYGKRRIFVDVEVRYPGYSPKTYATELATFCNLVSATNPCTKYSGAGYLDILDKWPINEEYWWAAYSSWLSSSQTWVDYKNILSSLSSSVFTKYSPGFCRLWQCTGDGVKLPGFGQHAMDVNKFFGTFAEAVAWFGVESTTGPGDEPDIPVEEPQMAAPIGLYTEVPGWTKNNPNFNFVAGLAQKPGLVEPNPNIKPIEQEAIAGKIPMLLWWEHFPWAYSEQQWGQNNWPGEGDDYIFQNFKAILGARTYAAVVISVNTYLDKRGLAEDKQFLAFSARMFAERVQRWLKTNRPLIPLIIATSNAFISAHAPDINNWVHNYESMAFERAKTIEKSYPIEGDKPAYLGASPECPWWRYYEMSQGHSALIVYRGQNGYPPTLDGMYSWLNLTTIPDDGGSDPGDGGDPTGKDIDFVAVKMSITKVETELVALKKLLGI